MRRFALLVTAVLGLPLAARAQVADAVAEQVRTRATAAGFQGTILIGARDGASRTLVIGPAPIAADAVWRWASITKQLAAVLAMQEVAKGTLDLESPVARYWPEWAAPNAGTIRIRDLLLHNSGLPQPDESPADTRGVPSFYGRDAAPPATSAAAFCAGPPRATAPAKFEYNNCDTIVLAQLLGRITGRSFEALVTERFGAPLRMSSLGVYRVGTPIRTHVAATGESSNLDSLMDLGVFGASGGAYGTIADLWKFDHALLSGALLPAAERDVMWTSSRDNGYSAFFQWVFPTTLRGCAGDRRIVERQGEIGGIEHRNFLLPESGRALILFGNHGPANYGAPWQRTGLAYELLSLVECSA